MRQITPTAEKNKIKLGPRSPFRFIIRVSGFSYPLENKLIDWVPGTTAAKKVVC